MASRREVFAIAKKQLALRDQLWPGVSEYLWDRQAKTDTDYKHAGFTTIPKTMPLIQRITDQMSNRYPLSSTYVTLWCSTWDNSFVTLSKSRQMAFAAGFGGQRGVQTWADRMKRLRDLHFIDIKPGDLGPMTYAIIWNPHMIIQWHRARQTPGLTQASYNALVAWALDIGAKDMTAELPAEIVQAI
jgi:hypothetical protein